MPRKSTIESYHMHSLASLELHPGFAGSVYKVGNDLVVWVYGVANPLLYLVRSRLDPLDLTNPAFTPEARFAAALWEFEKGREKGQAL